MTPDDVRLGIEIVGGLTGLFIAGRFVGRIEAAVNRILKLEAQLELLPSIRTQLDLDHARLTKLESYHKQLAIQGAEMRGRYESTHDGE